MTSSSRKCAGCPVAATLATTLYELGDLLHQLTSHERMCAADVADLMQPMVADLMRDMGDVVGFVGETGADDGQQ